MKQPEWLAGLTHKDWLFDGAPIRGAVMIAMFNNLDWSKAWVDLGPSVAGNLGPYWHVPLKETYVHGELYACGETIHRLYPKALAGKWLNVIRKACEEVRTKCDSERLQAENRELQIELAKARICIIEMLAQSINSVLAPSNDDGTKTPPVA